MTVSEKIARVFEIVGYLWLPPSIVTLFLPLTISIVLIFGGKAAGVFLLLIPLAIFGAGVFLLLQYYRHSRGLLDDDLIIPLWAATLVFNLLLLVSSAYGFIFVSHPAFYYPGQRFFIFTCRLLIFWLAAAVLLSIAALISKVKN